MLVFQALLGIVVFIALALPFSSNVRAVKWRIVALAIALQFVICLLLLKAPGIREGLQYANRAVEALSAATMKGTSFVYGYLGGGPAPFTVTDPKALFTFAFQSMPLVIVISALASLLWYWRILPVVISGIAYLFRRTLGTRGPVGLVITSNIFLGQVEAPLLVRPYLARMTQYELLLVLTAGMAMIAGSVMVIYATMFSPQIPGVLGHLITKSLMSVPASIMFAHLMLPEGNEASADLDKPPSMYESSMDAITRGTSDGLHVYMNVLAILIVLIAFVALANSMIGAWLPEVNGAPLSMERVAGWVFAPIAWLMGIPWGEAQVSGSLLGVKIILNEFIAYLQMRDVPGAVLGDHSRLITLYALCGFANLSSMGIQISGIGVLAPERRGDLTRLAFRALVAATLASCVSGAIVGIIT
jgi:CNT family concentrative nucleoside transporter